MSNYLSMCQALKDNVGFNDPSPIGSPDGSPFDAAKLRSVVNANKDKLSRSYRSDYAKPLADAMPELVVKLKQTLEDRLRRGVPQEQALAEVTSFADTMVGAVSDAGAAQYAPALHRFEAVVSNFYRSFLSRGQRAQVSLPLIEAVPPLVTFAPMPDQGPFTLPADAVNELIGVPIGVVSLPGSYREHPLIWPSLAHETGGHDVLHADPGLLDELAQAVQSRLPGGTGALWASWIDETASDVYGLLNIGPAFAVSLAAFFSALEVSDPRGPPQKLGTIHNILPVAGNQLLDVHPVDILRLHVAMGVVSSLTALNPATQHSWLTLLGELADEAAGGATTIEVLDVRQQAVVQQLPLTVMAQAAKAVGRIVATERLTTLAGHSIQDIETWDDADEAAAQTIRGAVAQGQPIVALGDDAQLLAGTTMALLDDAGKYADITKSFDAALDDSFARDPIFGVAAPRFMFVRGLGGMRGIAYSRTPTPPTFPLSLEFLGMDMPEGPPAARAAAGHRSRRSG